LKGQSEVVTVVLLSLIVVIAGFIITTTFIRTYTRHTETLERYQGELERKLEQQLDITATYVNGSDVIVLVSAGDKEVKILFIFWNNALAKNIRVNYLNGTEKTINLEAGEKIIIPAYYVVEIRFSSQGKSEGFVSLYYEGGEVGAIAKSLS